MFNFSPHYFFLIFIQYSIFHHSYYLIGKIVVNYLIFPLKPMFSTDMSSFQRYFTNINSVFLAYFDNRKLTYKKSLSTSFSLFLTHFFWVCCRSTISVFESTPKYGEWFFFQCRYWKTNIICIKIMVRVEWKKKVGQKNFFKIIQFYSMKNYFIFHFRAFSL